MTNTELTTTCDQGEYSLKVDVSMFLSQNKKTLPLHVFFFCAKQSMHLTKYGSKFTP